MKRYFIAFAWLAAVVLVLAYNNQAIDTLLLIKDDYKFLSLLTISVLYILFAVLILPCSFLTVGLGIVAGFEFGIILSIFLTMLCTLVTYEIMLKTPELVLHRKYILQLSNHVKDRLRNLNPILAIALLQSNPMLPGASSGYIFSSIGYGLGDVIVGCFIGTLLPQILMIGLGNAFALSLNAGHLTVSLVLFGAFLFVFALLPKFCMKSQSNLK